MLLLSKLDEEIVSKGTRTELGTNRYPGTLHPRGYEHQVGFRLDPFPVFEYEINGTRVEKTVFLVHGENTVVVQYSMLTGSPVELELTPLIAFRDYHSLAHANDALHREYLNAEAHAHVHAIGRSPCAVSVVRQCGRECDGLLVSRFRV
jgi:predicted glycogen debranching enzyme